LTDAAASFIATPEAPFTANCVPWISILIASQFSHVVEIEVIVRVEELEQPILISSSIFCRIGKS
jgi:hypothetical protein